MRARVKWFNDAKGFGFIIGDADGDIFLHHSSCDFQIIEDDELEFDVEIGNKGRYASNVRRAE